MRPIQALFDPAALRHNFAVARQHAGQMKLWAVVKANAYGHGLKRVIDALVDHADGFALIELDEAIELRKAGLDKPLLMLEGFYGVDEIPHFIEHRLIPVVHRIDQLQPLLDAHWPGDLPVYLKLDTGMHRLGLDAAALRKASAALAGKAPLMLMTHFADADGPRGIAWQMERFSAMTAGIVAPRSLANSAALLRYPDVIGGDERDWARPGIMLFGASPFPDMSSAAELRLRPVMTLVSELIAVQELAPGESVGYGCSFTAKRPMRIGVVACGYADGYPRHAPTGTPILVAGRRTRLLGRVSMDKLCIDLTDLNQKVGPADTAAQHEIGLGSEVVLWGRGLPVEEVAAAAGTISYTLFCALGARVPVREVG